jgi:hypothetical protein
MDVAADVTHGRVFRAERRHAGSNGSIWGGPLSKDDLGHHSLIFMVQEMAME